MAENSFSERLAGFFAEFGTGRTMVLSTSAGGRVSSRMTSVILMNGKFCFQTDTELRKYSQLKENPHAALCIDNIQIEGICTEKGHPFAFPAFCEVFEKRFEGSYRAYSGLTNERLFELDPTYIERWVYKQGVPYIETFDIINGSYSFEQYRGR